MAVPRSSSGLSVGSAGSEVFSPDLSPQLLGAQGPLLPVSFDLGDSAAVSSEPEMFEFESASNGISAREVDEEFVPAGDIPALEQAQPTALAVLVSAPAAQAAPADLLEGSGIRDDPALDSLPPHSSPLPAAAESVVSCEEFV